MLIRGNSYAARYLSRKKMLKNLPQGPTLLTDLRHKKVHSHDTTDTISDITSSVASPIDIEPSIPSSINTPETNSSSFEEVDGNSPSSHFSVHTDLTATVEADIERFLPIIKTATPSHSHKLSYKPYTLKDYLLQKQIVQSSDKGLHLGPDMQNEEHLAKVS